MHPSEILETLQKAVHVPILTGEPMSRHTTFRTGGPADYYAAPESAEEIAALIRTARELALPCYIIGNGSNLLVRDGGYRGLIIQIWNNMNEIRVEGDRICAQAGALLSRIAHRALDAELTGLECESGIPGTLGGAVVMNAGAYGGEMKDVLLSVRVLDEDGNVRTLMAEELELGYRTSVILKKGYIVLDAVLQLSHGDSASIAARMEELKIQRVSKQPLEYPSAGSTFKRPEGYFAGKLIQDAGLKGYRVGGAEVSQKHSGFVINVDHATSSDVLQVIADVQKIVQDRFGVFLEPEVRIIGEDLHVI